MANWSTRKVRSLCSAVNHRSNMSDKTNLLSTETPEQLTNGNHPEETQEEDNTGGMSLLSLHGSISRTCY